MLCPHCGTELRSGETTCSHCGFDAAGQKPSSEIELGTEGRSANADANAQDADQAEPRKPAGGRKMAFVVAAVILVLALAAIALFATLCAPDNRNAEQPQAGSVENEPGYKAAVSAYEEVLGEYEAASGDDANAHRYFSYVDLNGDGTPELLIGEGEDPTSRKGLPISKIMSFQDGALIDLGTGPTEISPRLCKDGVVYSFEDGHQSFGNYIYAKLADEPLTDVHSQGYESSANWRVVESFSWADEKTGLLSVNATYEDGTSVSKSYDEESCTNLITALIGRHPIDTSVKWELLR